MWVEQMNQTFFWRQGRNEQRKLIPFLEKIQKSACYCGIIFHQTEQSTDLHNKNTYFGCFFKVYASEPVLCMLVGCHNEKTF